MSQEATAQAKALHPIDGAIAHLAGVLGREREAAGLSPGDRAELRRMDPLGPALPSAAWQLLTSRPVMDGVAALGAGREQAERAVAIVIQAMVEAGGPGAEPIGSALAKTKYAEQRFVRLLRARGLADAGIEARYAARWCGLQGERVRFADRGKLLGFARFILAAALNTAEADHRAHAMARDYFAASPT